MRAPTSHTLNAVEATIGRPPKLSKYARTDGRFGIVNGRAMRAPTSHTLNPVGATIGRPPKLSKICSHRRAIWRRKRTRHARPYKPYPQRRRGDHRSSAKKGNIIPNGLILPFLFIY